MNWELTMMERENRAEDRATERVLEKVIADWKEDGLSPEMMIEKLCKRFGYTQEDATNRIMGRPA